MNQADDTNGNKRRGKRRAMTDFMDEAENEMEGAAPSGNPIADLFTEATVMFADIAGFTAWGSAREPTQVFVLLETIYAAFDALARKRKVFKVETIGDCYVAGKYGGLLLFILPLQAFMNSHTKRLLLLVSKSHGSSNSSPRPCDLDGKIRPRLRRSDARDSS